MTDKTFMFQYCNSKFGESSVEDTGLISKAEAMKLFNTYYEDAVSSILNGEQVQMVIWCDCKTDTDYGATYAEIDSRDIRVIDGKLCSVRFLEKEDFIFGSK
jgi:hypothetical protein